MRYIFHRTSPLIFGFFILTGVAFAVQPTVATAATLQLSWVDNSQNENGFSIERKVGTNSVYSVTATVGPNVTTYKDINLADATTYCYRVNAFNSAGYSPYSPEACATTPTPPPTQQFTLTINLVKQTTTNGTGNGTVTSNPAGINCGSTCSATFNSGTVITLTATPAAGSTFVGWSGTGCSGAITLTSSTTCTATFQAVATPPPTQQFTLTINLVKQTTTNGTGNGTVTSNPAGINCGSTCSASFSSGTVVALNATPASGSTFAGWSGTGCSTGTVTMNTARSCTATFIAQTFGLSIAKTGSGTVTSSPAGINCGSTCTAIYNSGTVVALSATPASGFTFAGWSGTGCATGTVTMNAATSCTATFTAASEPANQLATRIGVFRPSTGEWFLDYDGDGQWNPSADIRIAPFGYTGDYIGELPVVGTWSGTGHSNIGAFNAATGSWHLDTNGNGVWEGCGVDTCVNGFGQPGDFPVTRKLSGVNGSIIGTFTPRAVTIVKGRKKVQQGFWNFDLNGNSNFDGCSTDECDTFGKKNMLPVVGDWNGTGQEELGIFLSKKGQWRLDSNGNGILDKCRIDPCLKKFGIKGDMPVVGDWDGTGKIRIGVFRPSTGQWFLDTNGNGKFDGCTVDACLGPFGQLGDLPVAGKW